MKIKSDYKISFIIPVFNASKYIEKCVNSIINQNYDNIEIIIIDDGSTDESYYICKKLAEKDKRIVIIKQKNKGQSIARNVGIEKSSGDWVCFVDSDDWIDEKLCDKVIPHLYDDLEILFFGYYDVVDNNEIINYRYKNTGIITEYDENSIEDIKLSALDVNICREMFVGVPWGKFYSRKILIDNNIRFKEEIKIYEDSLFVFEFLSQCNKAISIDYASYYYRTTSNSVCKRYRYDAFDLTLTNIKIFNKIIGENYNKNLLYAYYTYVVNCFLNCITLSYCHPNNKEKYIEKKKRFINDKNNYLIKEALNNCDLSTLDKKTKIMIMLVTNEAFFVINILKTYKRKLKNIMNRKV